LIAGYKKNCQHVVSTRLAGCDRSLSRVNKGARGNNCHGPRLLFFTKFILTTWSSRSLSRAGPNLRVFGGNQRLYFLAVQRCSLITEDETMQTCRLIGLIHCKFRIPMTENTLYVCTGIMGVFLTLTRALLQPARSSFRGYLG